MVHPVTKTFAAILSLALLVSANSSAEISWSLHPSISGPDGPSAPYVTATLGPRQIKYVPPIKWKITDTQFIPPGVPGAYAFANAIAIDKPAPWTTDRLKTLHDFILSHLPPGAKDASILSEGPLPVQIDGQPPCEISATYAYYGQTYSESVIFIERDKTQFQFHLDCPNPAFPSLHALFLSSLLSLDGI